MCINARRFDLFAIFNSLEPDETEVITYEELLELDNWVLLEPIEEDGQTHALVNLAVEASLSSHNQAEMEMIMKTTKMTTQNIVPSTPQTGAGIESLVLSVHAKLYGWNVAFHHATTGIKKYVFH